MKSVFQEPCDVAVSLINMECSVETMSELGALCGLKNDFNAMFRV